MFYRFKTTNNCCLPMRKKPMTVMWLLTEFQIRNLPKLTQSGLKKSSC